jgi:hypothetical protein
MGVEAALIASGASLLGGAMAGRSAERAARTSADAQMRAAQLAAEEQRFRPVGISSRFGRSMFEFGPEGRLTGAGYEASPEIRALQDRLSALYGTSLGQAEQAQAAAEPLGAAGRRLFGLGEQYLAESPEAARQRVFNELQAIRRPEQMREEARLGAGVFGRGRAGLNIGGAGQPELFALARAREEQRARDFAQAEQAAQQRIGFGTGLFGTGATMYGTSYQLPVQALAPFQAQFGVSQLLEQTAQQPLDIGAQLGGRTATAGQAAGQSLLTGGLGAAQTRLQGSLVGPSLMASNIANVGQQYMQGQQQQQLFDRLLALRQPSGFRTGFTQGPSAEFAAQYFGGE